MGVIGSSGAFLVVPADSPYKTLADLLAYAKANPGKLNFGYFNASSQVPAEVLATQGRRRMAGRRLQGDRQCLDRPLCRRHPVHVRRPDRRPRPGGGQQGAAARASPCPSAARSIPTLPTLSETFPGFTSTGFLADRRAQGDAAADPGEAERADQRGHHLARDPRPAGQRVRADARPLTPRAVRRAGPRGARQVGGVREDRQIEPQ